LNYVEFAREFQAAHRLPPPYEGKCSRIHGHNFRVELAIETDQLDPRGFVIEFQYVKDLIDQFDHRLILAEGDPWIDAFTGPTDWIVQVPYAPTTENMAKYLAMLLTTIVLLRNTNAQEVSVQVIVRETASISARAYASEVRSYVEA